jgi:2-phospho-L-lactate guanylyltransferase
MRTAAILPVKRFAHAKQRLGASVADPLRLDLARAMVGDVLEALARTESIAQTIVVTCEDAVVSTALEHGASVLRDSSESGQPAAATLGVERAIADGFERVLCVPGDCPALDPAELGALLEAPADTIAPAREVVIVPDRHGSGTNGLLLSPPDVIAPAFGLDSCERHRALARSAGASWRIERPPSLLLDIDTGADLDALRQLLAAHSDHAARTRAVLGQPERTEVLSITTSA